MLHVKETWQREQEMLSLTINRYGAIIAYAGPPTEPKEGSFLQYDIAVDGCSEMRLYGTDGRYTRYAIKEATISQKGVINTNSDSEPNHIEVSLSWDHHRRVSFI